MADSPDSSSNKSDSLDLEQLRDLNFAPQWSSPKSTPTPRSREDRKPSQGSGPPRDRRPARRKPEGDARPRNDRYTRPEPYNPIVDFSIYPEDEPFDLLTQSIRSSLKVYELFEISRLILDKTDRMVAVVSPLTDESPPLYVSVPDRQVFRDEATALQHSAGLLLPTVFVEQEEEVQPPSGKFSSVLRCKVTGKYLPPRSYHRFQALLQEHQRVNCPEVPMSRVEKGLEPVAEEEAVQEWLQSMSRRSVFRVRTAADEVVEEATTEKTVEEPAPAAQSMEEQSIPQAESQTEEPVAENPPVMEAQETEAAEPVEPSPDASSEETDENASEVSPEPVAESKEESVPDSGEVFDSREAAVQHLIRTRRDDLLRETRQARVPARSLVDAEDSEIGKSFQAYVEQQKRFPLETANNVRMKLRKGKFFIFKKGKKGISYVSAVRKRNRPKDAVFADSAEKIITLLESNSNVKVKALPGLLFPERVDSSGKVELKPEETRSILNDLKWLKSEGYLYEYGDGSLEIHHVEQPNTPKVAKKLEPVEPAKQAPEAKPTPEAEGVSPAEASPEVKAVPPVAPVETAPSVEPAEESTAKDDPEDGEGSATDTPSKA